MTSINYSKEIRYNGFPSENGKKNRFFVFFLFWTRFSNAV